MDTRFKIPESYNINAKKLAEALREDKGITLEPDTFDVVFYPPNIVKIRGLDPDSEEAQKVSFIIGKHRPKDSWWLRFKRWASEKKEEIRHRIGVR